MSATSSRDFAGVPPRDSVVSPIRLRNATKAFRGHVAVSGLDLDVPRGSIYGLLGPNGSGKTTTIRMIMGILLPDSGEVELLGGRPAARARERVGYLPEERGVYQKMRVLEALVFLAEIRGVPRPEARRRATEWLDRVELGAWALRKVDDLSKGMQQKVQFIATVLHDPEVLVLDEPFSGLDPINQAVLEEIVREFHARGATVLFSTHLMEQAERLCERVCLISRARKVLDGALRDLKRAERSGVIAVEFDGDDGWLRIPEVERMEPKDGAVHVTLRAGTDQQLLLQRAVDAGIRLHRFQVVEPGLREIFIRHAGRRGDETAP
ncbi:MAG: ATP-binding cassette domain-containing protein [Gemmatimonadetes bacterium]|nr:ATP-binding cassette domain-containing protein [Gemmatimonadota bacterium]